MFDAERFIAGADFKIEAAEKRFLGGETI